MEGSFSLSERKNKLTCVMRIYACQEVKRPDSPMLTKQPMKRTIVKCVQKCMGFNFVVS